MLPNNFIHCGSKLNQNTVIALVRAEFWFKDYLEIKLPVQKDDVVLAKWTDMENLDPKDFELTHSFDISEGKQTIAIFKHLSDAMIVYMSKLPKMGVDFSSDITIRPPLGLKPRKFVIEERLKEIEEAISRYLKAVKQIPIEWLNEYNELLAIHQKL